VTYEPMSGERLAALVESSGSRTVGGTRFEAQHGARLSFADLRHDHSHAV
jgi:hypothetical protein